MNDLTVQLRDVHLPPVPSWWPLSTLGYICLATLIFFITILSVYALKRWLKGRARRKALKQIAKFKDIEQANNAKAIASLSILLRRVALAYYPRHEVAGLTGKDWIEFLNKTSGSELFNKDMSEMLLSVPYQKNYDKNFDELLNVIELWIKKRN